MTSGEDENIAMLKLAHGNIATILGRDQVIDRGFELISVGRANPPHVLEAGDEAPIDGMQVSIAPNDLRVTGDVLDSTPAFDGRDKRIARDTGVTGCDFPLCRRRVPFVDDVIVLNAGVGALPGGRADLIPQVPRAHGLGDPVISSMGEIPGRIGFDGIEKGLGQADTVVGVLARDGLVGLSFPSKVIDREGKIPLAFLGKAEGSLDVRFRDPGNSCSADGFIETRVEFRVGLDELAAFFRDPGRLHDFIEMRGTQMGPDNQGGDLLLFLDFEIDEGFDVGMIDVEDDHLGRAAGGAPGFDRAGGGIPNFEPGHQAGARAAPGEAFAFTAEGREIGPAARSELEQSRLASPEVHDPVVVDEIVCNGLDVAGGDGGVFVCVADLLGFVGVRIPAP